MSPYLLIVTAVKEEAALLAATIESPRSVRAGQREMTAGVLVDTPVNLLVAGPGQVNTVQALTSAIEWQRPAAILQVGCAGGFKQAGINIGDIAIASEEIDAHLGLEPERPTEIPVDPLPFSIGCYGGFEIKNRYAIGVELTRKAQSVISRKMAGMNITVNLGPFLTVSTITASDRRAEQYFDAYQVCMESMEGAGAAHVALHYGIPFLEIRAAANVVGKRERNHWNLPLAWERSQAAVMTLLKGGIF
ncbi:MAG: futalosine hydrolase [Desulfobacterales bacterium]|jgi:futalosine hydrolase|nr:futalosine hydrolase [Desulfobacterales bacterium]